VSFAAYPDRLQNNGQPPKTEQAVTVGESVRICLECWNSIFGLLGRGTSGERTLVASALAQFVEMIGAAMAARALEVEPDHLR
jgi:hypothetical protein